MSNESSGHAGTVMLAFVAGAVAGAAVALLFAPASGEETREYLNRKAREGRNRARDAFDRQREGVVSAIERGREAFQQARGEGHEA